jgi:uncharacterized MnhB-related membrane protein
MQFAHFCISAGELPMMELLLQFLILLFICAAGTGVVLTRSPLPQTIAAGFYGGLLILFFVIFQAPDVALSEAVINAGFTTAIVLLVWTRILKDKT